MDSDWLHDLELGIYEKGSHLGLYQFLQLHDVKNAPRDLLAAFAEGFVRNSDVVDEYDALFCFKGDDSDCRPERYQLWIPQLINFPPLKLVVGRFFRSEETV